ncbi:hypothetical protein Tco_0819571 [Tanacetum coccineum]|uniref:Uncharacterized protein n=1 Tax=Tanacetum coccineum TaxID=301880 RepID=A0ABQ5A9V5_9ASTR
MASNDDQVKQIMPLIDKGGLALSLSNLNQFKADGEDQMTIEEAKAQMEEIKRLAELKAKKEKSEKRLKVLTNKALKAQAPELAVDVLSCRNMEIEPDTENMTISEYLEYKAAKERRSCDDVRSRRSLTKYNEADIDSFY